MALQRGTTRRACSPRPRRQSYRVGGVGRAWRNGGVSSSLPPEPNHCKGGAHLGRVLDLQLVQVQQRALDLHAVVEVLHDGVTQPGRERHPRSPSSAGEACERCHRWVGERGHEEGCVCVKEDEETIRQKIGVLANVYIPETHWQRPGRYHKQTSQEPCCQAATHPSITAA
jgi:hypothetical protein